MQLTPNYRLRKPEGNDPVAPKDFNDNADVLDTEVAKKLDKTGDASNVVNAFAQAGTRANLSSGEKLSISLGKIMKWFSDLKTVAFSGKYTDLTERPTIPAGGIADASKIIDNIDDIAANTQAGYMAGALALKKVNSDLAGYKFGTTSDGKPGYIMPGGADTVIPFKSHTIFDASVSVGSSDASSVTVPLTKYYPNYSKITAANIFVKYKNGTLMGYAKTGGSSFSSVLGLSYNNSTGNLTISNAGNNTAGGFYYYRGSTQVFTICIVP